MLTACLEQLQLGHTALRDPVYSLQANLHCGIQMKQVGVREEAPTLLQSPQMKGGIKLLLYYRVV